MKTFLNVLYRRILYKIPLKLLLILLVLFGLLFLGFSNASYTNNSAGSLNLTAGQTYVAGKNWEYNVNTDTFCMLNINTNSPCNFTATNPANNETVTINSARHVGCLTGVDLTKGVSVHNNGSSCNGYNLWLKTEDFYHDTWSTLQCQTEYNLIPISSVDQNYCTTNNLCPSQECPSVPVYTGDLSQLYINNVLHVGASTILMDIPDEIDWDYTYTMGGNVMNIDIVGYNVDYDKINEQINLQNFKPSSEDLSQVVSGIIPLFVPGLCIILLLYFIFKFIKKIF